MKLCKDCEFFEMQTFETQQGLARAAACTHTECRDPIHGAVLPAEVARKAMAGGIYTFCGIQGKHFKLKEVKAEPLPANVIQLAK